METFGNKYILLCCTQVSHAGVLNNKSLNKEKNLVSFRTEFWNVIDKSTDTVRLQF